MAPSGLDFNLRAFFKGLLYCGSLQLKKEELFGENFGPKVKRKSNVFK